MSLLPEETETGPYIGTWFFVDSFDWTDSRLLLKCVGNPVFNPDDLTINSKKIVSWFFNYLLENNNLEKRVGWHVVQVDFDNMQIVETKDGEKLECFGIRFSAFRATVKREKLIRITGDAFYDWQTGLVKLPVGGHVSAKIPLAEIDTWPEVQTHQDKQPGYLYNYMETYDDIFAKKEDAIDLQALGLIEIYHVPA